MKEAKEGPKGKYRAWLNALGARIGGTFSEWRPRFVSLPKRRKAAMVSAAAVLCTGLVAVAVGVGIATAGVDVPVPDDSGDTGTA